MAAIFDITLTFTASELITDVVVVIKDVEGNALSTTTTNPSGYNWETIHTVDENSVNGLNFYFLAWKIFYSYQ